MKSSLQLYIFLLTTLLGATLTGCNSDSTWGDDPQEYTGTAVKGFSLKANASVLNNLDSVYFSVDLINATIFNAQPMPQGTNVSSLAVTIATDVCSVAQFTFIDDNNESQTVDYLANADVKINFSHGPVNFHIVSFDGSASRDYTVTINVATEKADSLYWDKVQSGNIFGIAGMTKSKTVKYVGNALTLSMDASGNSMISTFIPAATTGGGDWNQEAITPAFDVNRVVTDIDVESFTSTESGDLYLLANNGTLFKSSDGGKNFATIDHDWVCITAPYSDGVVGVKRVGGENIYAAYPSSLLPSPTAIAADFPVKGFSGAAIGKTIWAANPQVTVIGGLTASGNATGAAWTFDGNRWAKISDKLPARSGYSMTNYRICETDTTSWRIVERNVLIAFGGLNPNDADAQPDKTVYISRDMGVNWQEGSEMLQLPAYIPFTTGASLLVFDKTLGADAVRPMAVTPITTWDCPYLYLFGGYGAEAVINPTYWSGVVNHLKVKPLQ